MRNVNIKLRKSKMLLFVQKLHSSGEKRRVWMETSKEILTERWNFEAKIGIENQKGSKTLLLIFFK